MVTIDEVKLLVAEHKHNVIGSGLNPPWVLPTGACTTDFQQAVTQWYTLLNTDAVIDAASDPKLVVLRDAALLQRAYAVVESSNAAQVDELLESFKERYKLTKSQALAVATDSLRLSVLLEVLFGDTVIW